MGNYYGVKLAKIFYMAVCICSNTILSPNAILPFLIKSNFKVVQKQHAQRRIHLALYLFSLTPN